MTKFDDLTLTEMAQWFKDHPSYESRNDFRDFNSVMDELGPKLRIYSTVVLEDIRDELQAELDNRVYDPGEQLPVEDPSQDDEDRENNRVMDMQERV